VVRDYKAKLIWDALKNLTRIEAFMKKSILTAIFVFFNITLLLSCATSPPPKAIYAIAKQDRYSGVTASRDFFRVGETPCVKISGYGNSTFSYKLYKEGMLESFDSGSVNKLSNNDILTCWKNLPGGSYKFQIYDSSGKYVDTITFRIGE
jgi:hypothetical protein